MPETFMELIDEIDEMTEIHREEIKERVWNEALNPGWNVMNDATEFNIDFHIYNDKMENFYRESYGFVFETYLESIRCGKRRVMELIESRITEYLGRVNDREIKILMLGDGIGCDLTRLYSEFKQAKFFYYDVPGSKTYDFAIKRFQKYEIEVELINRFEDIPLEIFDVIVFLEVLEHLADPIEAIKNISNFLKMDGIILVTESFAEVNSKFPTHLKSNIKYAGRTPFLFHKSGLLLNYYSKEELLSFRPTEYIKRRRNIKYVLNLYFDGWILPTFFLL